MNLFDNFMETKELIQWLRDNSSGVYRPSAEAADLIESLLSERQEWKCTVGGETFRTDDKSVADEWRQDGLDVERYFILSNNESYLRV
jgi:hypothetical protein